MHVYYYTMLEIMDLDTQGEKLQKRTSQGPYQKGLSCMSIENHAGLSSTQTKVHTVILQGGLCRHPKEMKILKPSLFWKMEQMLQ